MPSRKKGKGKGKARKVPPLLDNNESVTSFGVSPDTGVVITSSSTTHNNSGATTSFLTTHSGITVIHDDDDDEDDDDDNAPLGLITLASTSSSSSSPQRHPISPTYAEYIYMSHLAYLGGIPEKGAPKDQSESLTLIANQVLGIDSQEENTWQQKDFHLKGSGYVGAIFIHHQRKQIVIAHAGTLPKRFKTIKADAVGVLCKKQDRLVLDAIMQSQDPTRTDGLGRTLESFIEDLHYHLSFTGHSLGGFLAEMSVYACHRGFGLYYPNASAVVFDSPGALEVMQAYESNIPQHQTNFKKLNIVSFLSSPNIVNTLHGHPGILYRLIRDMPISTFSSYLLNSHSIVKMASLFNPDTGLPSPGSWIEMQAWPQANYDELLSLKKYPLASGNIVITSIVGFIPTIPRTVVNILRLKTQGFSIHRMIGGEKTRRWWRLIEKGEPKNYHLEFDTSTDEGLKKALETGYIIQKRGSLEVGSYIPMVNINLFMASILKFHHDNRERMTYKKFIEEFNLPLFDLPEYFFENNLTLIRLYKPINTYGNVFCLIDYIENMIIAHEETLLQLQKLYIDYQEQCFETQRMRLAFLEGQLEKLTLESSGHYREILDMRENARQQLLQTYRSLTVGQTPKPGDQFYLNLRSPMLRPLPASILLTLPSTSSGKRSVRLSEIRHNFFHNSPNTMQIPTELIRNTAKRPRKA